MTDMKYNILITYDTGDTFHQDDGVETIVELNCDLKTAEENLNRIREHYKYCDKLNKIGSWFETKEGLKKLEKDLPKQPWYTGKYWEYSIKLINSDGEEFEQRVCWTGYFERLVCGEVVPVEESLPKFEV